LTLCGNRWIACACWSTIRALNSSHMSLPLKSCELFDDMT
jgi:hypothetical protein